ncbi:hypothetical protein TYRP_010360, partial [Tyrophagus putrescentiae]
MAKIITSLANDGKFFVCFLPFLTSTLPCKHIGLALSSPSDGARIRRLLLFRRKKFISSLTDNVTTTSLTLAPFKWRPRPHTGLKIIIIIIIIITRASVSMLMLFIFLSFLSFSFLPWAATHGQLDTGGRSAEEVGNTSHKWCAASARSVSTALSSLHICWVIKRSGPSRYYCPSSDVGGPKRTVDKDGRLSEDGEAD